MADAVTVLYHRATEAAAAAILADGFRDFDRLGGGEFIRGVWLSDQPLDCNEWIGVTGDVLLEVALAVDIDEYEIVEFGKPYREWAVPAVIVNRGQIRRVDDD